MIVLTEINGEQFLINPRYIKCIFPREVLYEGKKIIVTNIDIEGGHIIYVKESIKEIHNLIKKGLDKS